MAGKNLGESLGKVAGQAAIWPFVQEQLHNECVAAAFPVGQFDIIRAFVGITEKSLKKVIGPFFRENCR